MKPDPLSRRALLLALAGMGGLIAGGKAMAMDRKTISGTSELGLAYANHCTAQNDANHASLIGDLQAMLAQRSGTPGQVLTQTAYCPICGCPVTVTRVVD
jgi:hypothetical protein